MRTRPWPVLMVLALLLVGAVVAVGTLSGGLPQATPETPRPARGEPPVRESATVVALSVDVTPSGAVWLTTAGTDCGGCVLVWRQGPQGEEWQPLRQVGSQHRPGQIRMTDDSLAGVIGGNGLWVTTNAGSTWSEETALAIGPDDVVQADVSKEGPWALVRRSTGPPELWHLRYRRDAWEKVPLPVGRLDPDAGPTAVDGGLLLWVAGEDVPQPVWTRDRGRSWERLEVPCRPGTTPAYVTCSGRTGLRLLVRGGGDWQTWPLAAALGPARNLSPVAAAESVATSPDGVGYVVVRGNLLMTGDRGLGGWAQVE